MPKDAIKLSVVLVVLVGSAFNVEIRKNAVQGIDWHWFGFGHCTECLIQVDRLDKLLADQIILPRQFAVAGERLLHAIGVAAAQRPGRVPRQQSFYLLRLRLLVYRVHGQPLSIPSDLSSSASRLRA